MNQLPRIDYNPDRKPNRFNWRKWLVVLAFAFIALVGIVALTSEPTCTKAETLPQPVAPAEMDKRTFIALAQRGAVSVGVIVGGGVFTGTGVPQGR